VRYYLLREIPFGEDGDFSEERLKQRYSSELGNALGNLLHRVLSMTEKYFEGKVPARADSMSMMPFWTKYHEAMETFHFQLALEAAMGAAMHLNNDIDAVKPWALAKTDTAALGGHMYEWLESLRQIAWMLAPLMPEVSRKMLAQLGVPGESYNGDALMAAAVWGGMNEGSTIAKGEPMFPRIEEEKQV
jgi:methionyl-tRNA synthetase